MRYWVVTSDDRAYGPYDDFYLAYEFATTNFGIDGVWEITITK